MFGPTIFIIVTLLPILIFGQGTQIEQECETMLPNGTTEYLACMGTTEPLYLLLLEPQIEPESATCGLEDDLDRSLFCTLDINFRCHICNASNETTAHPPEYMVDPQPLDTVPTWWQSISWYDYPIPLEVNIMLSFNHTYKLNDDISITFQSGRPQYMALDKSLDHGVTWEVYQYFARDCADLNMTASSSRQLRNSTEVICTEDYSASLPRSGGIVMFDLTTRYGLLTEDMSPTSMYEALESNTEFQDFLTVTDLRIRLLYPATDGLEISGQSLNLLKYYYAISDIDVFLICDCNLHGAFCLGTDEGVICDCQHNTMGVNCEQCLPLYNNRPWRRGSQVPYPTGTANECQKCTCNGHATSCTYNATLQHGVCDSCAHNTSGLSCDVCIPGFYPNVTVPIDSENRCVECDCYHLGTDSTVCSQDAVDGVPAGQCSCKANVTGRSCNQCIEGYFGLESGSCRACSCNSLGTVNGSIACHQETGQCFCKPGITGMRCDRCGEEFFQYPSSSNEDCLPCNCDPGGSLSPVCHNETGNCQCREHLSGTKCILVDTGYFVPSLDYLSFDAWSASSDCQPLVETDREDLSGQGYLKCSSYDIITFTNITIATDIPRDYRPVVKYTYPGFILPMEINLTFSVSHNATDTPCPYQQQEVIYAVNEVTFDTGQGQAWIDLSDSLLTISPLCVYDARLSLDVLLDGEVDVDALMLLPLPDNLTVFQRADELDQIIFDRCLMSSISSNELSETCDEFGYSLMAELFNGALECDCHPSGSLSPYCSSGGGQCFCTPGTGVGGRRCDQCLPGYHSFSLSGCTACNCNRTYAIGGGCDYQTGQCFCEEGVALAGEGNVLGLSNDLQCSSCLLDHYPAEEGCAPCNCNSNGSLSMQCDLNGVCTCKDTVNNDKCDRCQTGFYAFSLDGCMPCDCNIAGSTSQQCHPEDGSCSCKANVIGEKCDQCAPLTFNLQGSNPRGCQECFCYGHSTACQSAQDFIKSRVVSDFGRNSLDGWEAPAVYTASIYVGPSSIRVSHPPNHPEGQFIYLRAPTKFLGNKKNSYGLSFHISMRLDTGTVSQSEAPILMITGGRANHTISYSDEAFLPTNQITDLSVAFFEDLWLLEGAGRVPSRMELNDVLTDISEVEVRASFGVDTVTSYYSIFMEEAEYRTMLQFGDEIVYTVEECVCGSSTTGSSCESCTSGTFREDPDRGQYSGCVPCGCNDRAETCDPNTGICLDCALGTAGDHCEVCALNVRGQDCGRCRSNYYGHGTDLFDGGCMACGCNVTGTVNGRTNCNNEDGQCVCQSNYGGRQCDRCSLNHYGAECLPCDVCYDSVLEQYQATGIDELQSLISAAPLNDSSFMMRYNQTNEMVHLLMSEIDQVENGLSSFDESVYELNTTMIALMDGLERAEIELNDETNLTVIQENIDAAQGLIGNATMELEEAYHVLNNGYLQVLTEDLSDLLTQLLQYNSQLSTIAGEGSSEVDLLAVQVERIRNTTENAVAASANALQIVLAAQAVHDEVTLRLVTIYTDSTAASSVIDTLLEDARRLALSANATLMALQDTVTRMNNVTYLQERLDSIRESLEEAIGSTGDLSGQIDSQTELQQSLSDEALSALNITSQLREESSALNISGLASSVESANQRAVSAVATSEQLFEQAETQLEVVQDFQNISTQSQESALAASGQLEEITDVGVNAYSLAEQQRLSLSTAAMCAEAGLANASLANEVIADHHMGLLEINQRVEELQDRAVWDVSMTEDVRTINDTILQPTAQQCMADRTEVRSLEVAAEETEDQVRLVTTATLDLVQEVNGLMDQLGAINQLDLSQLDSLRVRVSEVSSKLTQSQYEEAVLLLRNALDEQNDWIEATTREINGMQAQINALESFQIN